MHTHDSWTSDATYRKLTHKCQLAVRRGASGPRSGGWDIYVQGRIGILYESSISSAQLILPIAASID